MMARRLLVVLLLCLPLHSQPRPATAGTPQQLTIEAIFV